MTFIIAEAGVNHGGKWEHGLDLIDAAKEAGADAVKFQMFDSRRLWGDDRLKHLQFGEKEMLAMRAHCAEVGIEFMCTPFGAEEVRFLAPLVRRMKVASGCLERIALLHAIRDTRLPVIMSTGMSDLARIRTALGHLGRNDPSTWGVIDFTLLHCVSAYPCLVKDVNLRALDTLLFQYRGNCSIGYSDHTQGILAPIAAVARGATVIEKHITIDRNADGPDHKASIEPVEFSVMVAMIRDVESMLGDGSKKTDLPCEAETAKAWYGN